LTEDGRAGVNGATVLLLALLVLNLEVEHVPIQYLNTTALRV